jgi:phage terminase small subunit
MAKEVWERLANDPAYAAIFGPTDQLSLEIVCENYATWMKSKKAVEEYQEVVKKSGERSKAMIKEQNKIIFGLDRSMRSAERALRDWLESCGMTPPTRSRTEPPDEDTLTEEPIDVADMGAEEMAALRKVMKRKRKAAA